tara:strand:- start:11 stop:691 length:681 start_codon:yes stop_codon:yes gene_type:complete
MQSLLDKVNSFSRNFRSFKILFFGCIVGYQVFRNFINFSPLFRGELALIEISQVSILFLNIYLIIKNKYLFKKKYSNFSTNIKIFILFFIIYEELSFITANTSEIFQNINVQSEINLHNLRFLNIEIFNFPVIGNIGFVGFSISLFLCLMGLAKYFKLPKYLDFFTLEKRLFPYSFIYVVNIIYNRLLIKLTGNNFLLTEITELLIYLILYFDTIEKSKYFSEDSP